MKLLSQGRGELVTRIDTSNRLLSWFQPLVFSLGPARQILMWSGFPSYFPYGNESKLCLASLLPLESRKNLYSLGLLLNKIKRFDPGDLIAQLVGHLNSCVILEKSLGHLRFSSLCQMEMQYL